MYLENSKQGKDSGEEEQSIEVMIAEQCQLPKVAAADLTHHLKQRAESVIEAVVGYAAQTVQREAEPSVFQVELQSMNRDKDRSFGYCDKLPENTTSNAFFESDESGEKCKTSGLSQPLSECDQHCESFRPCKSCQHYANHSVVSKCFPCSEHGVEALQVSQQCEASDHDFDHEPNKWGVIYSDSERCNTSESSSVCADPLALPQQHKPSDQQHKCFDSEPELSMKASEEFTMNGCSPDMLDSVDSLDCDAELDENEASDGPEQNETDEDIPGFSHFNAPAHVYLDGSEASECCDVYKLRQGNYKQANMSCDHYECVKDYFVISQYKSSVKSEQWNSGRSLDFFSEEDGSSYCSSVETKSFKTCLDGSIPSEPCTDSSEESDKGAQEDSSDEQTQWESFEDEDEETEQSRMNGCQEDGMKTPVDEVIEDYFDLFDRVDYHGHTFLQKRQYISCFDGGDIEVCLYLQSQAHKPTEYACKEISEKPDVQDSDTSHNVLEESGEEGILRDYTLSGSTKDPDECIGESGSSLADDETECDEAEEDPTCEFYDQVSDISEDKGANSSPASENDERMFAPFINDISVEGDAYEDEFSPDQLSEATSTFSHFEKLVTDSRKASDEEEPAACSEMEPYWSLVEGSEQCDPGVEEYYAYQIKSIQSSHKHDLNGFINNSLTPIIIQPNQNVEQTTTLLTTLSDNDCGSNQIAKVLNPPSDIIHSVASELANIEEEDPHKASEQTSDTEEEEFDNEASEFCECEYCIPPDEQAPVEPLLPQTESRDAKKICVVIDLDETLVHSSFKLIPDTKKNHLPEKSTDHQQLLHSLIVNGDDEKAAFLSLTEARRLDISEDKEQSSSIPTFEKIPQPVSNADFTIPVEIEGTVHQVYVLKRPHVDEFLKRMGELFECVLFTASLSKYADPVSDMLDKWGAFRNRLFRESCVFHRGNYVKDLSRLGRDLNKVIIIDNSPISYIFHPENAVPVVSWFDDKSDTELLDLIPFFERLSKEEDIYPFLTEQRTSG